MLRALRILTVIAVLFCALHVGEDAYAFDSPAGAEWVSIADSDDGATPSSEAAAHAVHHHCPAADGLPHVPPLNGFVSDPGLLFAPAIAALDSLPQAPPIAPPLA